MTPMNICAMAKIKGLHALAITDHNSALNLAAMENAAKAYDLLLLPGIEITTREEVHLLAYFPSVEKALEMGGFLYTRLPEIRNDPRIFGEQCIMSDTDVLIANVAKLLISATDLTLNQTVRKVLELSGLVVPAHINRGNNGLLINLGLLPDDVYFPTLEVAEYLPVPQKILKEHFILHSSDAHHLGDIFEAVYPLDVDVFSVKGILNAIGYGRVSLK